MPEPIASLTDDEIVTVWRSRAGNGSVATHAGDDPGDTGDDADDGGSDTTDPPDTSDSGDTGDDA